MAPGPGRTADVHSDPLVSYLLGQLERSKAKSRERRERRRLQAQIRPSVCAADIPAAPPAINMPRSGILSEMDCRQSPHEFAAVAARPGSPPPESESEFEVAPSEGSESELSHPRRLSNNKNNQGFRSSVGSERTSTTLTSSASSTISPSQPTTAPASYGASFSSSSLSSSASSSSSSTSAAPSLSSSSRSEQNLLTSQDAILDNSLSPYLLSCVRAWRQAFVGVNKVLQEPVSRKWSRRQILSLVVQPVQQSDMYMATNHLAVPESTARLAAAGRPGVDALETAVTVEFFNTHTFVRSGANTLTRRMAMRQSEMYALYRAHYPMLMRRAESFVESGIYQSPGGHMAKQINRAREMSAVEGWDQGEELERREDFFKDREYEARVERAKFVRTPLQKIRTSDDPDKIEARSYNIFWEILSRAKIRFLRSEPIYNCPIHANADLNRRQLAAVQDKLELTQTKLAKARAARPRVPLKVSQLASRILPLKHKLADLEKKVETARVHQKHYEIARKHVKTIEDNLAPGQVLIFRDFVNQYNEDKKKINNLIFVVLRPHPSGVGNIIDYSDNIAQTKCTAQYHAYCLDFLFQRDDIFPPGTTVFISGDHGPHFWCWDTLAYQSTVFRKFGLKIHVVGLCSYHAYNRCDAHGANIKKAVRAEQLRGAGPKSPAEIAHMTNNMPAAEAKGIRVRASLVTRTFLIFVLFRRKILVTGTRTITPI